jgi:hypothetical protein
MPYHSTSPNSIFLVCLSLLLLASSMAAAQPAAEPDADAPSPERVQSAIEGGLQWLAENQVTEGNRAGSWPSPRYPTAATSFAGLAFLANGHLPGRGPHGENISHALGYVEKQMTPEGYLGSRANTMYVHGIATLFGLSCLGMLEDAEHEKELARWCRRSLDLILKAQKVQKEDVEQGGWRYSPYSVDSDLSVSSWQLAALYSARQSGFEIPDEVFEDALSYLGHGFVRNEEGDAGYMYRPGVSTEPEPGITGTTLFVKSILEEEPGERFKEGLKFLREFTPSWGGEQYKGYFYCDSFYMSQGMFQVGGKDWARFAPAMKRVLVEHQQGDGHWDFPPDNRMQSRLAGPAYSTAMAVLILSLDKQYLPMYQKRQRLY